MVNHMEFARRCRPAMSSREAAPLCQVTAMAAPHGKGIPADVTLQAWPATDLRSARYYELCFP